MPQNKFRNLFGRNRKYNIQVYSVLKIIFINLTTNYASVSRFCKYFYTRAHKAVLHTCEFNQILAELLKNSSLSMYNYISELLSIFY